MKIKYGVIYLDYLDNENDSNLATYIHRWNEYCCYITISNTPLSLPALWNRSLMPKSFIGAETLYTKGNHSGSLQSKFASLEDS